MTEQKWWQQRPLPNPARSALMIATAPIVAVGYATMELTGVLAPLLLEREESPDSPDTLSTVGELRKALRGVPDNLDVIVRAWDDNNDYLGQISAAGVHQECGGSDQLYFALDCGPTDDDSDPPNDGHVAVEIPLEDPEAIMIAHVDPNAGPETREALRGLGNAVIRQMAQVPPVEQLDSVVSRLNRLTEERDQLQATIDVVADLFGVETGPDFDRARFLERMRNVHMRYEALLSNGGNPPMGEQT